MERPLRAFNHAEWIFAHNFVCGQHRLTKDPVSKPPCVHLTMQNGFLPITLCGSEERGGVSFSDPFLRHRLAKNPVSEFSGAGAFVKI